MKKVLIHIGLWMLVFALSILFYFVLNGEWVWMVDDSNGKFAILFFWTLFSGIVSGMYEGMKKNVEAS